MIANFSNKYLPKPWIIIVHVVAAASLGYAIPWTLEERVILNLLTIYVPALSAVTVAVVAAIQAFRADDSWLLWTVSSAVSIFLNLINSTFLFLSGIPLFPKLLLLISFISTVLGAIFARKTPIATQQDITQWNETKTDDSW